MSLPMARVGRSKGLLTLFVIVGRLGKGFVGNELARFPRVGRVI